MNDVEATHVAVGCTCLGGGGTHYLFFLEKNTSQYHHKLMTLLFYDK